VDVVHPLEVGLRPELRHETHVACLDGADRRLRERLDPHEPLRRQVRLDDRVAALAASERVVMWFHADQPVLRLQALDDLLARVEPVESRELPRFRRHRSVGSDDDDFGKLMAQSGGEVVRVVRGRDFHDPGPEFAVDEDRIFDHGKLAADDRQDRRLTTELRGARIVRMDRESGVAEHRLRPRRRDDGSRRDAGHVVPDAVQRSLLVLVDDFEIRHRGSAPRAPVDDVAAAIDEILLVETHERVAYGRRQVRVESEALARPVE
jgi:hypothetical protein